MRSHRTLLAVLILLYLLVYALTGLAISLFDSPGVRLDRGAQGDCARADLPGFRCVRHAGTDEGALQRAHAPAWRSSGDPEHGP